MWWYFLSGSGWVARSRRQGVIQQGEGGEDGVTFFLAMTEMRERSISGTRLCLSLTPWVLFWLLRPKTNGIPCVSLSRSHYRPTGSVSVIEECDWNGAKKTNSAILYLAWLFNYFPWIAFLKPPSSLWQMYFYSMLGKIWLFSVFSHHFALSIIQLWTWALFDVTKYTATSLVPLPGQWGGCNVGPLTNLKGFQSSQFAIYYSMTLLTTQKWM